MANRGAAGRGRPKGAKNKRTLAVEDAATRILDQPEYQADLAERARTGRLGPMEPVVWYFRWGKPREGLEHSGEVQLLPKVIRHVLRTDE
jgi:hypothetical protein